MKRTIQTASFIEAPQERWKALNEIDAVFLFSFFYNIDTIIVIVIVIISVIIVIITVNVLVIVTVITILIITVALFCFVSFLPLSLECYDRRYRHFIIAAVVDGILFQDSFRDSCLEVLVGTRSI